MNFDIIYVSKNNGNECNKNECNKNEYSIR